MAYRRRKTEDSKKSGDFVSEIFINVIVPFIALAFFYFGITFLVDRAKFVKEFSVFGSLCVIVIFLLFLGAFLFFRHERKQYVQFKEVLVSTGTDEELKNFVVRFGKNTNSKNVATWQYRSYCIEKSRIEDLIKSLRERNIKVTEEFLIRRLEELIDEKEYLLTTESIQPSIGEHSFSKLSGSEFELLLQRLYEKMGYVVEHSGKTGDQGGDLILSKDRIRTVLQAKRYSGSVGNSAIQEASAAKAYYDCLRASVVTTSSFTPEAITLAQSNKVELVDGETLQHLLMAHLQEFWQ